VFADPVVHFVRATDTIRTVVLPGLARVEADLRALLAAAKKQGLDVSGAAAPVKDLRAQVAAMSSATGGLSAHLLALTAADWNANHAVLLPALNAMSACRAAGSRAVQDVRAVEAVLR